MKSILEQTHIIPAGDCQNNGLLKISGIMSMFEDASVEHSKILGFDRDIICGKYGAIWMLSRILITLYRPVRSDEILTVRTWPQIPSSACVFRDFEIYSGIEKTGEAVSTWVVTNAESRSIMRPNAIPEVVNSEYPPKEMMKNYRAGKIKFPADMNKAGERHIVETDIDVNGHMNNVQYARLVEEYIPEITENNYISSFQITFSAECLLGEKINIMLDHENGRYLMKGKDDIGRTRFESCAVYSGIN